MVPSVPKPTPASHLRALINAPTILVLPGVFDGFSTRLVEKMGYTAAFITGSGALSHREPAMSPHPRHLAPAILGLLFILGGCSTLPTEDPRIAAQRNQTVIDSPIRTDQDRRMDAARHPAEFLRFTEVKPGMQVLDVSAGGGYTSQLLALAVGPTGKLWAQAPQPGATLMKRVSEHPQPNLVVVARPFEDPVPD